MDAPAKPQFQRKQYFINKRLQIKYMISLVVPLLLIMLFMGGIMFYSSRTYLDALAQSINRDLSAAISTAQSNHPEDVAAGTAEALHQVQRKLETYRQEKITVSQDMLRSTYTILGVGLLIVLAEIAFITIFISHKLAGPVYRLEKFAQNLSRGQLQDRIHLRDGDELKDVAASFNSMGDIIQARFAELGKLAREAAVELPPEKRAAFLARLEGEEKWGEKG
jgi:nitrogen fixation/metabolism regulation signal transduction histidine kinase